MNYASPAISNAPPKRHGGGLWFRVFLTCIALGFLTLFVVIPAVNVFSEALSNGWGAYKAVFFPPEGDVKRLAEIQSLMAQTDKVSFAERRKLRAEEKVLEDPVKRAQRNWSAVRMTLGITAIVIPLNMLFGLAAAWAVTKFRFRGRSLLVSVIDLPFSVSPVIAGLIFVLLFGAQGYLENWWTRAARWPMFIFLILPVALLATWIVFGIASLIASFLRAIASVSPHRTKLIALGLVAATLLILALLGPWDFAWERLAPSTWKWPDPASLYWRGFGAEHWWPIGAANWYEGVIFTPFAIVLASIFVTFPFVARSLIPLMEVQGVEAEQAALTLGASGWYTFRRVTLPSIKWALLYGAILCSARALGEFGAVSVVSGHLDSNDTMPLRVEKLWQEYKTQPAFTVASLLAMLAVLTLILKGFIEWKTAKGEE